MKDLHVAVGKGQECTFFRYWSYNEKPKAELRPVTTCYEEDRPIIKIRKAYSRYFCPIMDKAGLSSHNVPCPLG